MSSFWIRPEYVVDYRPILRVRVEQQAPTDCPLVMSPAKSSYDI